MAVLVEGPDQGRVSVAALYLVLLPDRAPSAARHCLRTGFLGLRALAGVYRVELPADPRPDAPIALTYLRPARISRGGRRRR